MTLETKLIKALKSKDALRIEEVFEEIYKAYAKLVYFSISQYVFNKADVEELTQEVFVGFFNRLDKASFRNLKYYLVASGKNKAINFLKAQKDVFEFNEAIVTACTYTQDSAMEYAEVVNDLKAYLDDREIEILFQHAVYELSFREIASMHKIPIGTALSVYYRAIRKFKNRSKQNEK